MRWTEEQLQAYLNDELPGKYKPVHKFGRARRIEIDGYKFASQKEADRYVALKWRERAGEITDLEPHPGWPIVVNKEPICRVELDFRYWDKVDGGKWVYEDVKSVRIDDHGRVKFSTDTSLSKIKRKLLKAIFGIEVTIVE